MMWSVCIMMCDRENRYLQSILEKTWLEVVLNQWALGSLLRTVQSRIWFSHCVWRCWALCLKVILDAFNPRVSTGGKEMWGIAWGEINLLTEEMGTYMKEVTLKSY